MNPASLLMAEAPPAQPPPSEPTLAAQPVGFVDGKPFAKIMERTITEVPAEPVPRKDEQDGDGDTKKNDAVLATIMNVPVSAPVVLPVFPLLGCDQSSTIATTANSATPAPTGDPATPVAVIGSAISTGTAATEPPKLLPLAVPVPVLSASPVSINSPSASGQMRADSQPTAAENMIEQQAPQPSDGKNQLVLLAGQIEPDQLSVPGGTVIAKEVSRMKRDAKADKNSVPAEKTLPRGNFSTSVKAETTRSSRNKEAFSESSTESSGPSRESFVSREKPATVYGAAVAEFKHFDMRVSTDETHVEDVHAPQMEKVSNAIAEQVVTFKKVGVDSMDAVLRPDHGTELSLHLSVGNNGQVEVVARVERGNFEGLQAHWSELQSSLAQQGVRVGELHQSSLNNQASSHDSSPYFGGATGEQQQAQRQTSHSSETLAQPSLVASGADPTTGRTSTPITAESRGWEKWA